MERKFVGPFIGSAFVLFAAGAAFAYYVMPIGLNFLATFLGGGAIYLPDINSYLSFLLLLIVAFGLTFELPVVIILLGILGTSPHGRCGAGARGSGWGSSPPRWWSSPGPIRSPR